MTLLPQRLIIALIIIFTSVMVQGQWHLNPNGINGYTLNTKLATGHHLQLITADKPVARIECSQPEEFTYYRVADSVIYIKGIGQARHLIISTNNEHTIVGIFMLAPQFNNNYEEELTQQFGKKQFMVYNNPPVQSSLSRGIWIKDAIRVITDPEEEKQLSVAIIVDTLQEKPGVRFRHSRKVNTD